jgi:AraC-like DNA-binding protein
MKQAANSFFRYFPISPRDKKWGLYLLTAGEASIPPGSPYPPQGHPESYAFDWAHGRTLHEYQIVYISTGRGWFESKGVARRRIESGDVFFLFPGVWHRYRPDPKIGWTEHWVGFDGLMPRHLVKNGFFSPRRPVLKVGHEEPIVDAFHSIIAAIKLQRPALQQVMAGLTSQIFSLLYVAGQHGNAEAESSATKCVREAIRLMHSQPQAAISLEDLPQQLNVSYTWFRRTFARHTGLSPYQYLLELRLAAARKLLTETTLTVKEVAAKAGFTDEHYFCRIFRRKTGLPPGQWRRRSRGETPQTTDDDAI